MIALNAQPIIDARMRGFKPDDLVLVSLVGHLDADNHTVRAIPASQYDWRWVHGLDLCIYIDERGDWVDTVKAIALHRPDHLSIWNRAEHWGAGVYLIPTAADIAKPVRQWDYELDFLAWLDFQNADFIRPGEVSLYAGVNGHGKSMFLSQVELDLCYQAERVMVASFEMRPVQQMHRMSRQAYAGREPAVPFLNAFHKWTDGRLWIYDHVGAVDWRKVIAVMRYAAKQFGITQFVVDSLMKCVKGEDDYNGQKDFVNELCAFAQAHRVHVHLVHHVRKGESEHKAPGKFDIKGAGAITDMVDNVFIVWRNKKAEQEGKGDPTCIVACEKQRNGEFEGKFGFWFDLDSQQYLESVGHVPSRYSLGGA